MSCITEEKKNSVIKRMRDFRTRNRNVAKKLGNVKQVYNSPRMGVNSNKLADHYR